MADIYIEPTAKTPLVEIKIDEGYVKLEGRSLPENVRSFYYPLLNEFTKIVEKWSTSDIQEFNFHIKLGYFNSSSAKFILDILNLFIELKKKYGKYANVHWYYEQDDIDMKEAGLQISELLGVNFNYIEYNDED